MGRIFCHKMAVQLGSAYGKVGLDISGFRKNIALMKSDAASMQASVQKSFASLKNTSPQFNAQQFRKDILGTQQSVADLADTTGNAFPNMQAVAVGAVLEISAALVDLGRQTIAAAAEFEQAITNVAAVSEEARTSSEAFHALRDAAMEMGATTRYTAAEAAGGLQFLAMAGLSAEESIAALPGTLALATAGNLDLARTSDIASNVLTGMGLAAGEMNRVADVMAKTMSTSNVNVDQLGQSFAYAAPQAAQLGITVEELSASFAVMGNSGLQASRAGTSLDNMLASLIDPTRDGASAIEELGISVFDLQGQFVGLPSVIEQFRDATADMNDEQKNAALGAIFQTRGLRALNLLIADSDKNLEYYTDSLATAGGTAQEIADRQLEALNGQLTLFQSALNGIAVEAGSEFSPMLAAMLKDFTALASEHGPAVVQVASDLASGMHNLFTGIKTVYDAISPLHNAIVLYGEYLSGSLIPVLIATNPQLRQMGQFITDITDPIVELTAKTAVTDETIRGMTDAWLNQVDAYKSATSAIEALGDADAGTQKRLADEKSQMEELQAQLASLYEERLRLRKSGELEGETWQQNTDAINQTIASLDSLAVRTQGQIEGTGTLTDKLASATQQTLALATSEQVLASTDATASQSSLADSLQGVADEAVKTAKSIADYQQSIADAELDQQRDMEDAAQDHANKLADIDTDYQRDVQDAHQDHARELQDIERDTADKLQDAARQHGEKLAEIDADYADKRTDAISDAAEARADAESEYHDAVESETADHQQTLADIESDYADKRSDEMQRYADERADIERDAQRAVADATRDYASQQADIERDYQRNREDAARDHAKKRESIERDYRQTINDIARDYEQTLADIEREANDARLQAATDFSQEIAVAEEDAQKARSEATEEYSDTILAIDTETAEKRAEQASYYNDKLVDIEKQYQETVSDAQQEYQQERLDLEQEYQQERAGIIAEGEQAVADLQIQARQQLVDDLNSTAADGSDALRDVMESDADYIAGIEDRRQEHADNIAAIEAEGQQELQDLRQQHADAIADIERQEQERYIAYLEAGHSRERARELAQQDTRQAIADAGFAEEQAQAEAAQQERLAAEQEAYAAAEQQAAVAYAKQQAQQAAHLGQMLIEYVHAQALMNGIASDKAEELTASIADQFGVQQDLATAAFGNMRDAIDQWAASGGDSNITGELDAMRQNAADAQSAMDALTEQKTADLTAQFTAGDISLEEYTAQLQAIPSEVRTELGLDTTGWQASLSEAAQNQQDFNQQILEQQNATNQQLVELDQQHQQQLLEADAAYQEQIRVAEEERREAEKEALIAHQAALNEIENEANQAKIEAAIARDEALKEIEEELRNARLDAEQAYQAQLATIEQEAAQARVEAQRERQQAELEAKQAFEQAKADLERDYADALAELQRDRMQSLEDAERDHNERLAEIAREKTEKINDAEREHQQALQEIANERHRAVEEQETEHVKRMQELEADKAKTLSEINSELNKTLMELEADRVKAINEAEADHAKAITKINQDRVKAIADAETNLSRTLSDLVMKRNRTIADAETSLARTRVETTQKTARAIADAEARLTKALGTARTAQVKQLEQVYRAQEKVKQSAQSSRPSRPTHSQHPTSAPDRRAGGGPVRAGQTYLVGERGPELFVPRDGGTVVNAAETQALLRDIASARQSSLSPAVGVPATMAGSTINAPVTVNVAGSNASPQQIANEVSRALTRLPAMIDAHLNDAVDELLLSGDVVGGN